MVLSGYFHINIVYLSDLFELALNEFPVGRVRIQAKIRNSPPDYLLPGKAKRLEERRVHVNKSVVFN